jgi:uncharacterized membrane protein YgcG
LLRHSLRLPEMVALVAPVGTRVAKAATEVMAAMAGEVVTAAADLMVEVEAGRVVMGLQETAILDTMAANRENGNMFKRWKAKTWVVLALSASLGNPPCTAGSGPSTPPRAQSGEDGTSTSPNGKTGDPGAHGSGSRNGQNGGHGGTGQHGGDGGSGGNGGNSTTGTGGDGGNGGDALD